MTHVKLEATTTLVLNEEEIRALDALFGYNLKEFLEVFYDKLGVAYLKPHEEGLRSLHARIRKEMANPLAEVERIRKALRQAELLP